jgi:hypothetical protein
MRAHPTTSGPLFGSRSPGPLAELYRLWRARPRLESPRLFWALLSVAVLLDAAAAALAVCLVFFPLPGGTAVVQVVVPGLPPVLCGLALLTATGITVGRARGRALIGRWLYAVAWTGCAALAAWVSGRAVAAEGFAAWVAGAAGLAAAAGVLLEAFYRHGVLAAAGALVLALGLVLTGHVPAYPDFPGPRVALRLGGWPEARGLVLLGGAALLTLAWAASNLTLALVAVAPYRRSSIRTLADAAYRTLGLAVLALAGAAMTTGLPVRGAADVGTLAALAGFALLLHARFAGWVQELGLALGCSLGGAGLALAGAICYLPGHGTADPALLGWLVAAGLANASLACHAARRWYFTPPGE